MRIIFSPYNNPFVNLALEDFFLRQSTELPILFLFVNRPCVVLGRFQNPWLECQLSYLAQQDIWFVRRQSGGGCVYHDEGNLNFSYITSGPELIRHKFSQELKNAFKRINISLEISERNDLWLAGKKISGSAYKQTKFACFHHGTLLVNSDLEKLEESLRHTFIPKETKSISSVRSKVTTLSEYYPGIEIEDVIELLSDYFQKSVEDIGGAYLSHPEVQKCFYHLRSEQWLWNETPAFTLFLKGVCDMNIHKGQVLSPVQGPFTGPFMKNYLDKIELERFFPDFSGQHSSSNQIF